MLAELNFSESLKRKELAQNGNLFEKWTTFAALYVSESLKRTCS